MDIAAYNRLRRACLDLLAQIERANMAPIVTNADMEAYVRGPMRDTLPRDHGCARCVPNGDALRPAFFCGYHAARACVEDVPPDAVSPVASSEGDEALKALRAELKDKTVAALRWKERAELAEAMVDRLRDQAAAPRMLALPKRRHDELMNLWRNYGDACRAENEGRACPDGMSTRDLEVDMAAAFKELLDAAEVK